MEIRIFFSRIIAKAMSSAVDDMDTNNGSGDGRSESSEDEAEQKHWHNVTRTILLYETFFSRQLESRRQRIVRLPQDQKDRLPRISFEKFDYYTQAMEANQIFFEELARFSLDSHCKSFA